MYKPNYPSTNLEDLSLQETHKLMKVLRAPTAMPAGWIASGIVLAILAVVIVGGFYGIR